MKFNIEECSIKSIYGNFQFICFNWGSHEDENILCLYYKDSNKENPIVRIQSACFTGEIFRSTDCDCHEQLEFSLQEIQRQKSGFFIYMICDGRGAGIYQKTKGLKLGETDALDTADAYSHLGLKPDPRSYDKVIEVLKYLEIKKLRLLTNNPRKCQSLEKVGFQVERIPLEIEPTDDSRSYLFTKKTKMGHFLNKL